MRKRTIFAMVPALLFGLSVPAASFADGYTYTYQFNDGEGNCGIIGCGPNGCTVIEHHYCPREVDPNG